MEVGLVVNLYTKESEATQSDMEQMHHRGANRAEVCFQALTALNQIQLTTRPPKTSLHTTRISRGCLIQALQHTTLISQRLQEQMRLESLNRQLFHQVVL